MRRSSRFTLSCFPQRPDLEHLPLEAFDGVLWELEPGPEVDPRVRHRVAEVATRIPTVSYSTNPDEQLATLSREIGCAGHLRAPLSPRDVAEQFAPFNGADLAARLKISEVTVLGRLRKRETLLDLVRSVHSTLEPEQVAELVISHIMDWLPVRCWSLFATDASGQRSVVSERGLSAVDGPAVGAVAAWVIEHGEQLVSADLSKDERFSSGAGRAQPDGRHQTGAASGRTEAESGAPRARDIRHDNDLSTLGSRAAVAFPLRSRGRLVGVLVGLDPRPASRAPEVGRGFWRALQPLLESAAIAFENALLLKRAEALSVTDDLTGLANSRDLRQVLGREAKRSARGGRPLSLLFVDLDDFKTINDHHGHLAGSRALVEAGAVLRGCARETDVVARFGGDEFALVLPETNALGALAVANRVRDRIAGHGFLAGEGHDIRLTCSVGVATLPDMAGAPEELVQAADAAMYQVKARGKNGIAVAPPLAGAVGSGQ